MNEVCVLDANQVAGLRKVSAVFNTYHIKFSGRYSGSYTVTRGTYQGEPIDGVSGDLTARINAIGITGLVDVKGIFHAPVNVVKNQQMLLTVSNNDASLSGAYGQCRLVKSFMV